MTLRFMCMGSALASLIVGGGCKGEPAPGTDADDTDTDTTDDTDSTPEGPAPIVVIGAGVAGLSAARTLAQAGKDVIILEARGRVGGRIWHKKVGDAETDLGASWVHGATEENPVQRFITASGGALTPDDNGKPRVWDEGWGWLVPQDILPILVAAFDFGKSAEEIRTTLGAGASVGAAIDLWVDNTEQYQTGLISVDDRRRAEFISRWFVEDSYGGAADDQSLDWFGKDASFGRADAVPDGGYGDMINALADGLDIRTDEVVTGIEYGDDGVTITHSSGTTRASDVIVTVPLGVLKSGSIDFDPALPQDKLDAIDHLKMGTYEKVVLTFDTDFWSVQGYELYHITPRGPFPYVVDWSRFSGKKQLIFLSPADAGSRISQLGDDAVEQALNVLRDMFGETQVPVPIATEVTDWKGDEFARGSYSFIPVGGAATDMDTLALPVGDHLRFAGEHTSSAYYGTVHGAMISGLREAGAILGLTVADVPVDIGE